MENHVPYILFADLGLEMAHPMKLWYLILSPFFFFWIDSRGGLKLELGLHEYNVRSI